MARRGLWLRVGASRAGAVVRRGEGPLGPEHANPLDAQMMDLALLEAARAARGGEVPVGAVVYDLASGEVIATGRNVREARADPAGHAELIAIRAASERRGDWRLSGLGLAVTLEPCAMCAGLIVAARVDRVVYACRDPKAGACASLYAILTDARLNHRVRPIEGVRGEEASALLRGFFKGRRGPGRAAPDRAPGASDQRRGS